MAKNPLSFLRGKQLLLNELPFPSSLLKDDEQNQLLYTNGITKTKQGYRCERCGNETNRMFATAPCKRCGKCTYCRKCITMGKVSECTKLIETRTEIQGIIQENVLRWRGELSSLQKQASDAVIVAIKEKKSLLVWAVCGSGKTELLFQGIAIALEQGKRVCIATPRTDVVLELEPRLRAAFNTNVIALYGGSEAKGQTAPLTLTTTHQLLRYKESFDVMIIDEVDAFPYSADEMLQFAVEKAKKKENTTIYLTATPSLKWQQEVKNGQRQAVLIPVRYHRHPLPVPTSIWCGDWRKKLKQQHLPTTIIEWINQRLQKKKQCFLFVPHVSMLKQVVKLLKKYDSTIESVHAEDVQRKEKVQAFRDGTIPLLVTTTILERGVTVPNIDVAVFGADDEVFSESALVQIAGRVGRSANYPTGDVVFFHFGKTKASVEATKHIRKMNTEAQKQGMLD